MKLSVASWLGLSRSARARTASRPAAMSFGKASASPGLMTTQKAGALTQQIAKDEGMARRVLDTQLKSLEEAEGELLEAEVQRAPSPEPVVARKPPTTPAELQEYLLGPEQGLARALAGRVNPGYHRSSTKYVSSTKRDFDDPAARKEPVEPVSTQHFHSLDDIGKHAEATVRYAALLKGPAPKK